MTDRLAQSLAFRLAGLYAIVFALASALLFGALYLIMARALEARDRVAVERYAERFANAYARGGPGALRAAAEAENAPEAQSFFIRVAGRDNETLFARVPQEWIEVQVERLPVPGLGIATRQVRSLRMPQNPERDFAIAYRQLNEQHLLQVGRSADSRTVVLAPLKKAFLIVGPAAVLLSVGIGTGLAWRATRPLREVSRTARRILETGDHDARVPVPPQAGELQDLTRQINTLLDRDAANLKALRETLDNIAHDLRTPLTRLRGTAEVALRGGGDPREAREALASCIEESDRVLHLLEVLLDVSAAEAGVLRLNRSRIDLRNLVGRGADLYREVAEERKIVVETALEPAELDGDPVRLGQAVNNLLENALKYTPPGGRVRIASGARRGGVFVSVSDNGPGVPAAEREAVWRRLYRGDASRSQRGLGLGLSLVKAVVEAHGGTASIADSPMGGAEFVLELPASK